MKKANKRRTELDQIATQLRTMLRRDTLGVIGKGKLLLRSRELHADEHGEWQKWLAKNFDLTYRTALNYMNAAKYVAEYVAHEGKSETVSHFANLSPTVLYHLAEGHFDERVEAAILAEARKRRVDEDAAWAIDEKLAPPDDDAGDANDQEDGNEAPASDPEIEMILDGPPPAVPLPAPNPPLPDFALRDFDQAIATLKRLLTKSSAQFDGTAHTVDDLEKVESFIRAVANPQTVAAAGTHLSRSWHADPRRKYFEFLKSLKPGDFRLELRDLCRAVASLECGCTISVSEESLEEVSGDSC
jgi:hypothetical protein